MEKQAQYWPYFLSSCRKRGVESPEIITHGLDDITAVLFDNHGRHAGLSGTGLSGNDEGHGVLLISRFVFLHRRPNSALKEVIHFILIKAAFPLSHLAGKLHVHRTENLVRHVTGFYIICFLEHAYLGRHGKTVSFAELNE